MLKRTILAVVLLVSGASLASAESPAVAVANVNLRAGPATNFPVVAVVPAGARITTYGCTADYSWCDTAFGVTRGWVSAHYIQVVYNNVPTAITPATAVGLSLAIIAFDKWYWDTYYVAYPWYRSWAAYYRAYPYYRVAPVPRVGVDRTPRVDPLPRVDPKPRLDATPRINPTPRIDATPRVDPWLWRRR